MNKQDAAKFLGVSERTVAAHAAKGRLSVRYVKGKTRDVAEYDEAELTQLRDNPNSETVNREAESVNNETAIVVQPSYPIRKAKSETVQSTLNDNVSMFVLTEDQFAALAKGQSATIVPIADKMVLSLEEAATISGFSSARLRAAIGAEKLVARKVGRAWKMRRGDVERFVDSIFEADE